jgi:hypothetical protein
MAVSKVSYDSRSVSHSKEKLCPDRAGEQETINADDINR